MNRTPKIILITAVVIVIGFLILPFLPAYYSVDTYIDIHSGDIKILHRACNIKVKEEIQETDFSKLVHKLIGVPQKPEWKYCFGKSRFLTGKGYADGRWGNWPSECKVFVKIIDPNSIPESELKELLRECLSDMEKNDRASFDNRMRVYLK